MLEEGLRTSGAEPGLLLALAVARMNQGDFAAALEVLAPLGDDPQARAYREECLRVLGRSQTAPAAARRTETH